MPRNYKVGYQKPPREHQFKKGQSGNPRGRPKGARNLWTEIEEEFSESMRITENGRPRTVSKLRGLIKRTMAAGHQGDLKAAFGLLQLATSLRDGGQGQPSADVAADDDEVLRNHEQALLRRRATEPEDEQ